METNRIAKHTVQFYHAALTQALDAVLAIQEMSHETFETFVERTPGIPVEGRRAIRDWIDVCRQQTVAIKSVIDGNFRPLNNYFEE
jgi:hypothetical protein